MVLARPMVGLGLMMLIGAMLFKIPLRAKRVARAPHHARGILEKRIHPTLDFGGLYYMGYGQNPH